MAAMLVAPYNDSMRLGQGYNSFLQAPCLLNAVEVKPTEAKVAQTTEQPQTVSYSSRVVSKISEVARAMNISAGSAITNGSLGTASGNGEIDETKFGESDLNVVVSVKVINQTQTLVENVTFADIGFTNMQADDFHRTYGDTYISGFIEGGELHGVISIRTIDSSRRKEVKQAVVSQLNAATTDTSLSSSKPLNDVLRLAEVTVNVNWSGGGNINPLGEEWNLNSLTHAAANFPRNVAKCPQRTCAILSRYDTVPSFLKYAASNNIKIRRYDACQRFAADLLDMHMEHKTNLSIITHAMNHLGNYRKSYEADAVELTVRALIENRKLVKAELSKLVDVVEKLNVDPDTLRIVETAFKVESPEIWRTRLPVMTSSTGNSGSEQILQKFLGALPLAGLPRINVGESTDKAATGPPVIPVTPSVPSRKPATKLESSEKYIPTTLLSTLSGQVSSSDDYKWESKADYTSIVTVKFKKEHPYAPQLLLGLNDFYVLGPSSTKIGCKLVELGTTGFKAQMSTWGGQMAQSNRMNWAAIPPTKLHIETGVLEATTTDPQFKAYKSTFKTKPVIHTWIMGIDGTASGMGLPVVNNNPDQPLVGIQFRATPGGIGKGSIGFLAYDPAEVGDRIRVEETTLEMSDGTSEIENWRPGFARSPAVFVGIKEFAYNSPLGTRLSAEFLAADEKAYAWSATAEESAQVDQTAPRKRAYMTFIRIAISVEDMRE